MDALWTLQYYQKVLALNPIAYWMLDEKSGAVAYDLVSGRMAGAQNGTYTGVTLGQPGIGDGRTSPSFDGIDDRVTITSAELSATFSITQGTVAVWARVANAGVWTDGNVRNVVYFRNGGYTDLVTIRKGAANNTLTFQYRAGGVDKAVSLAGLTTTDWMFLAITWDVNAGATGEMRAFYNSVQTGATQTNLGVPGAIDRAYIGSDSAAQIWPGYISHCAVGDRALPPAEITELYIVP